MRRLLLLLLPLGTLVLGLTAVSAATASPPAAASITTSIVFPEQGEPFGTFTATEPLCPSGTFVDEFVAGGGAFNANAPAPYHAVTVRKTFTCANGSGTFTILFHPQLNPGRSSACEESGPFAVVGGTGVFATLSGHGDFCLVPLPDVTFAEEFTGTFHLHP